MLENLLSLIGFDSPKESEWQSYVPLFRVGVRMRRKVKGAWQYRDATDQEAKEHNDGEVW